MNPIPYCLNIHPGESLGEVRQAITTHALAVREQVAHEASYPLGLRLSAVAAQELSQPEALAEFDGLLNDQRLFVTGINGFPYGAFHGTQVKEAVYTPDWSTRERLSYTGCLAGILAKLLPEGVTGSISTVPLGYALDEGAVTRLDDPTDQRSRLYARQLALMAELLADLQRESGREIILALEPEPDCLLEGIDDTIAWFEDGLLHEGISWLASGGRRTREEAEALLRRHIGVCLDTCHFAVVFEDPLTALVRFESACIRVARIQLSAAVRMTALPESLEKLRAFFDTTYLHQTRARLASGRILRFPDLDAATLEALALHRGAELRTHFHIPLFYQGDELLGSTNEDLSPEFFKRVAAGGYPLETETYTFGVLPPALSGRTVVDSLVNEHHWVAQRVV